VAALVYGLADFDFQRWSETAIYVFRIYNRNAAKLGITKCRLPPCFYCTLRLAGVNSAIRLQMQPNFYAHIAFTLQMLPLPSFAIFATLQLLKPSFKE